MRARRRVLMSKTDPIERLSAEFHAIYQQEARRQAGTGEDEVRHPDDYDALPEHTKEYDRVLARHVISLLATRDARIAELEALLRECRDLRNAMPLRILRRKARLTRSDELRWTALAQYNSEKARGILHDPEWDALMADQQTRYNAELAVAIALAGGRIA